MDRVALRESAEPDRESRAAHEFGDGVIERPCIAAVAVECSGSDTGSRASAIGVRCTWWEGRAHDYLLPRGDGVLAAFRSADFTTRGTAHTWSGSPRWAR